LLCLPYAIVRKRTHKNIPLVGLLDSKPHVSIDAPKTARYNMFKKFILMCEYFNEFRVTHDDNGKTEF
jgi:hypothetical protein